MSSVAAVGRDYARSLRPWPRTTRHAPATSNIPPIPPILEGMATTIDNLVDELQRSYRETQERMSDPTVYNDHKEAAQVGRRLKELEAPHRLAEEWRQARADLDAAREDPELAGLVAEYEQEAARIEVELKLALVTADPDEAKDAIVEIRSGTGGDEAALWAGDLFRMLARYAENRGFKVEQLETSLNEGGGYKHVSFGVKGDGAYGVFKWEGGRTASSASPRRSRRGGSTPPRRRSLSCPRPRRSRSRSIRTT